ncbi:hypothetical protein EV174_004783 [Coemansia sp. RSA 2320]|nr:hypothetical protein EV174_004783 [Coemansia sp. RSA 2320]
MIELTAHELAFGKKLAHVDKEIRDQAVGALSVTLAREGELTYMEMLRHWKALFYCFWLSDKPLVQQELSWELANLTLVCKGGNNVSFVRAFWETVCREWFDIDKHRIDKYLLLVRRMVFFTFRSMQQGGWDHQLVEKYLNVYLDYAAHPTDARVPNSSRTHLADVYVDELVRLVAALLKDEEEPQAEIAKIPVATLLEPFMRFIGTTSIKHLPPKVQESVFENTVIRIAEAEELANAVDSDVDMAGSSEEGVVRDNQIEHETLDKVQFLIDGIPDIKARLLAVAGEETTLPLGRKRLFALYQSLCETFPDDENDVVLPGVVVVTEPIGAEARKLANKFKRKKDSKGREQKVRAQARKDNKRGLLAASSVDLDINALEHEATADEERSFQSDLAKIREMNRRAGFDADESPANNSKPASKKVKRAEKKAQVSSAKREPSAAHDDAPELVPVAESAAPAPVSRVVAANGAKSCADKESGAWVVRTRAGALAGVGTQKSEWTGEAASLLADTEKHIVVKDKLAASPATPALVSVGESVNGTGQSKSAQSTPQGKQKPTSEDMLSSEKKRLTWALERNSVKRFLKKVPMLPSPTQATSEAGSDLKPALRKVSAYMDEPQAAQSPLRLLKTKNAKAARRVSVNGHASTPLRSNQKQKQRLK